MEVARQHARIETVVEMTDRQHRLAQRLERRVKLSGALFLCSLSAMVVAACVMQLSTLLGIVVMGALAVTLCGSEVVALCSAIDRNHLTGEPVERVVPVSYSLTVGEDPRTLALFLGGEHQQTVHVGSGVEAAERITEMRMLVEEYNERLAEQTQKIAPQLMLAREQDSLDREFNERVLTA